MCFIGGFAFLKIWSSWKSCKNFYKSHKYIYIFFAALMCPKNKPWRTTAYCVGIYVRYEQLCWSSRDGATGVKQLSTLAALGEKMLLNQEGFSNSPSLQGNSKLRGQRSLWAAMEAICLVVMAQQVSPGWGTRLLKTSHPARKKIAPEAQYQECPPHTVTHSPHTRHNNPCLPVFHPVFTLLCLLCSFVREGCPEKMLKQREEEKMERTTMATIGAQLSVCFCLNVTGSSFSFSFFLRETPELHLCYKGLRTGSYPLTALFCVGSSLRVWAIAD